MCSASPDNFVHEPKMAPSIEIPAGNSVNVSIIDCTVSLRAPLALFMGPVIPGLEVMSAPCLSFLIEHSGGRKLLFDLGLRKDWQNLPPAVLGLVQPPWKLEVQKNVAEILQENGVDVAGGAIDGIIWSHWHFDHVGDPSTFPSSTDLIVGPGVVDYLLPGYPGNPNGVLSESAFAGRETKTIDFKAKAFKIGAFPAFDFFGDGSFYLLDVPGHAIGHICGLARTTSKAEGSSGDTFVFMGADTAHHTGAFRPTEYLPLPKEISPSPCERVHPTVCSGHLFQAIHPEHRGDKPHLNIVEGIPNDTQQAISSLKDMQEFDAMENILAIIAHDASLLRPEAGIEWFPHATMRDWKQKDLASKARWGFLRDYSHAVEINQAK